MECLKQRQRKATEKQQEAKRVQAENKKQISEYKQPEPKLHRNTRPNMR